MTRNGPARRIAFWTIAFAAAVLWPGRVLSALDGVPLDGRAEAVLIGVVFPALWWIDPQFPSRLPARIAISALLLLKLITTAALPQHGLCARFSTGAPFAGISDTIPIDEPTGALRSWDIRADWLEETPRCTAILDRVYRTPSEFPIWFVNLLNTIRPNGEVTLDISGTLDVDRAGTFAVEIGEDMVVDGEVGPDHVSSDRGAQITVALPSGAHAIQLRVLSRGERWRFIPRWDGRDAWSTARLTVSEPPSLDRLASGALAFATTAIVVLLAFGWMASIVNARVLSAPVVMWSLVASAVCIAMATAGRFERFASLLLVGSAFVPVSTRHRNSRTAFLLIGVPWLALFVAHAWPQIGRITIYSLDDDWHMYQAAAYRIFMNGYWLQGGTPTFYFQPLYRWIVGALHVLFGDSSVGETYFDAACLLGTALLSYGVVKRTSGFRPGLIAGALTLATFTSSAIWYLIGRGLSEIAGAGFMAAAAFFLMHARLGRLSAAALAGAFAVVMFYTRLNHLLLAGCLVAFLLPLRTASSSNEVWRAMRRVRFAAAGVYLVVVAAGVVLFAAHTWWYAGHFSLFYGTSFGPQQTGLRPTTVASPAVWSKIGEALAAQLSMREPPALDPRATLVATGALLSLLAVLQVPHVRRLPAALALTTCGAIAGSFIAHTHEYPGRMSVHVVPFAVGMTVCAASALIGRRAFASRS